MAEQTEHGPNATITILDLARAVYDEAVELAGDGEEAEALASVALWGTLRQVTPVPEMAASQQPEKALRAC